MHILYDMAYSVKWRLRWCDPIGMEGSWKPCHSSRWRSPFTRQGGRSDNDAQMKGASSARPNKVSNLPVKGYTKTLSRFSKRSEYVKGARYNVCIAQPEARNYTYNKHLLLSLFDLWLSDASIQFLPRWNVLNWAQRLEQLLVGGA